MDQQSLPFRQPSMSDPFVQSQCRPLIVLAAKLIDDAARNPGVLPLPSASAKILGCPVDPGWISATWHCSILTIPFPTANSTSIAWPSAASLHRIQASFLVRISERISESQPSPPQTCRLSTIDWHASMPSFFVKPCRITVNSRSAGHYQKSNGRHASLVSVKDLISPLELAGLWYFQKIWEEVVRWRRGRLVPREDRIQFHFLGDILIDRETYIDLYFLSRTERQFRLGINKHFITILVS